MWMPTATDADSKDDDDDADDNEFDGVGDADGDDGNGDGDADDSTDDDDNEACFSPLVDGEEEEVDDDGTHLETGPSVVVAPPYRESHVDMDTAATTVTTVPHHGETNDTPFVFCLGPAV